MLRCFRLGLIRGREQRSDEDARVPMHSKLVPEFAINVVSIVDTNATNEVNRNPKKFSTSKRNELHMLMEITGIALTHLFSATALTGEISNRFAFEYAALHLSLKVAASQLHLHEKTSPALV